jgi:ATP-dependent helicase/nuclease subunit A
MHAFFANLIRRFSNALDDVDPGFRIIEGAEKDALLARTTSDLLDGIAYRPDHALRDDLRCWLRQTASKRTITNALIALVDKRLHCREWLADALSDADDYAETRRRIVETAASRRRDAFCASATVRALIAGLRALVPEGSTDPLAVAIAEALAAFDAGDARALSSVMITQSGTPRRFGHTGSARTFGASKDELESARSLMNELAETVSRERFADFAFDDAIEIPSAECLKSLARLADAAISAYSRRKSSLHVLDFADLEDYAYRILDNESVLRVLRNQFRAIFIDEFQDTNRAQWRFFKRLATEDGARFRENSLFIVGDAKQAIYSFRGGEVEVFELARREIGHSVGFASNFRSRPNLLAFTNRFFRSLLTGGELYEAEAQDLRYQAEPDFPTRYVENGGSVRHIVVTDPSANEDAVQPLEREAGAVASLIRSICDGERDDVYGDIRVKIERGENAVALLFRRTTHQSLYEDALRAHGLRFVAAKGKGFFEREEIRDLRNAIRVVADPRAEIALAGVLRSPLFGCSDDGLLLYAALCRKHRRSFADRLYDIGDELLRSLGVNDDDHLALIKARTLIPEWRRLARCVGTAELVSHILADSGVYAACAVGANGAQRVANVEKLVDLAREYESLGAPTLSDFVRFLDAHLESADDEGDANLPDAGSIQLLTVHRAKGLQWPLVIVPDTNAKFVERVDENSSPIAIGRLDESNDSRAEVAMRYRRPDGQLVETAMWRMLRNENSRRIRAEQKRLLYVAFTRAESHLVFCTTQDNRTPPRELAEARSWADWIHVVAESEFRSEEHRRLCERTPADALDVRFDGDGTVETVPVTFDRDNLWRVPAMTPTAYRISDESLRHRAQTPPSPETRTPIAEDVEKARLGEIGNRLLPLAWRGVGRSELERRVQTLMAINRTFLRRAPNQVVDIILRVAEWLRPRTREASEVMWNRTFAFERDGVQLTGIVDVLTRSPSDDWIAYDIKYDERGFADATLPASYRVQAERIREGVSYTLNSADVRVVFVFADAGTVTDWSPTEPLSASAQLTLFG